MIDQMDLFSASLGPVAPKGDAWIEAWHNDDLPWHKLSDTQQLALLNETAKWLFAGRRWPSSPSESQSRHCIFWSDRVHDVMARHGWALKYDGLHEYYGHGVTWYKNDAPAYSVSRRAPCANYAAITAAAVCRRKAKYYGLW